MITINFNKIIDLRKKIKTSPPSPPSKKKIKTKKYYRNYYLKNREKILKRSRRYKEENKEWLLVKNLEYRMINEDKLKARFFCMCGSNIIKKTMFQHCKTIKHKKYISNLLKII
jgi:hypothetical protein